MNRAGQISIMLGIAGSIVAVGAWTGNVDAEVKHLKKQVEMRAPDGERLARIEVAQDSMKEDIRDIKDTLKRMERLRK